MALTQTSRVLVFLLAGASLDMTHAQVRRVAEPMLIDLDGDGITLGAPAEGVSIDVDGDGVAEQVAWTTATGNDAFVCIDHNKNGVIDVPAEFLGGTTGPPVGFAFLSAMDGLGPPRADGRRERVPDGRIDKGDAVYGELILWTDTNHNGKSEENELQSLDYAGVESLPTGYEGMTDVDSAGNRVRYRGTAMLKHSRGLLVAREVQTVRLARQ